MDKTIYIRDSKELGINWNEPEEFQNANFFLPDQTGNDIISVAFANSDTDYLISLSWYGRGPGMGSTMSFQAMTLESGERLYFWCTDFMAPRLLCKSEKLSNKRIDYLFLQKLFGSNGYYFKAQIFDYPADSISVYLQAPWDFVVDIVAAAFERENCWDKLLNKHKELWIRDYENPSRQHFIEDKLEKDIREKLANRLNPPVGTLPKISGR